MKNFMLFLIGMITVPCLLVFLFSLFTEEIQIGKGGNSLESHYLGKEILLEVEGLYKSMDVEEYVVGVLAGTIPADYDMETLKVQAILIRTNVLKEMQEKNTSDSADLSYDYLTVEERVALWGERNYEKYEKKMESAVVQTAGKVITHENALIMAFYHAVSIGKTAAAKEILGEDISYLQSVDSGQDVEAKHYMNIIKFTWEEAAEIAQKELQTSGTEASTTEVSNPTDRKTEAGEIAIQIEESTENGFVKKVSVKGNIYSGEEMAEWFHLPSSNFYVEETKDGVRFVCLGKGNCLGVSQYGANCMALKGKKAKEIIQYYYRNVSIVSYGK